MSAKHLGTFSVLEGMFKTNLQSDRICHNGVPGVHPAVDVEEVFKHRLSIRNHERITAVQQHPAGDDVEPGPVAEVET